MTDDGGVDKQEREAQWEKRATVLVQQNPRFGQLSSPRQSEGDLSLPAAEKGWSRSSSRNQLADVQEDVSEVVIRLRGRANDSCRLIYKKRSGYMKREVSCN